MIEEWVQIENYEGYYEVSNQGRVRGVDRIASNGNKITGRMLKIINGTNGYKKVNLSKEGKIKSFYVHQLVAIHFLENPNNYENVKHKKSDKSKNAASDLEWCDIQENVKNAKCNGINFGRPKNVQKEDMHERN